MDPFTQAGADFDHAAELLELAVRHLRVAARHTVERDVPRACAHAFAAEGHIHAAKLRIAAQAVNHAAQSMPE